MSDRPAETEYSAMQALLQMQGVSNNACGVRSGETSAVGEASSTSNTGNSTAAIHAAQAKLANMLRTGLSPSALLQQAQLPFSPSQLAALQAAAAQQQQFTQGSNSTGFGSASFHSVMMQHPPFSATAMPEMALQRPYLEALAQNPSFGTSMSRLDPTNASGAATNASMTRPPNVSPLGPGASAASMVTRAVANPGTPASQATVSTEVEIMSAEGKAIRKNEVEAALRSKPQRGRKRENLNAEERLELTRTRNREHAKSTR